MDVDLSGDGGVLKRVIVAAPASAVGPSDAAPLADVGYEGRLHDGTVFDSTREDDTTFSFEVGAGKVIKAWDLAVKSMRVGETARVTCTSDYAYGDAGSPPDIPPKATLVFEIELKGVRAPKGAAEGASGEAERLAALRAEREAAAAARAADAKKREDAKAAAAQAAKDKLAAKAGGGKKGKK